MSTYCRALLVLTGLYLLLSVYYVTVALDGPKYAGIRLPDLHPLNLDRVDDNPDRIVTTSFSAYGHKYAETRHATDRNVILRDESFLLIKEFEDNTFTRLLRSIVWAFTGGKGALVHAASNLANMEFASNSTRNCSILIVPQQSDISLKIACHPLLNATTYKYDMSPFFCYPRHAHHCKQFDGRYESLFFHPDSYVLVHPSSKFTSLFGDSKATAFEIALGVILFPLTCLIVLLYFFAIVVYFI